MLCDAVNAADGHEHMRFVLSPAIFVAAQRGGQEVAASHVTRLLDFSTTE